jgi:hypothetical protein
MISAAAAYRAAAVVLGPGEAWQVLVPGTRSVGTVDGAPNAGGTGVGGSKKPGFRAPWLCVTPHGKSHAQRRAIPEPRENGRSAAIKRPCGFDGCQRPRSSP